MDCRVDYGVVISLVRILADQAWRAVQFSVELQNSADFVAAVGVCLSLVARRPGVGGGLVEGGRGFAGELRLVALDGTRRYLP